MKTHSTLAGCTMIILCSAFASCTSSGKLMSSQNQPDESALPTKLKKPTESIVTIKDDSTGNVYVSVEGKLIFRPGSSAVDSKGKKALKPLGRLLYEGDENFSIMIKASEDSDEVTRAKFADNWSLSQARANTVMRILTESALQMAKANDKKAKGVKQETMDAQNVTPEPAPVQTESNDDSKKYILVLVNSL